MKPPATSTTFAALVLMLVLSGLDQTILSTALPSIVAELGGRELAPWVFSAYLLASTAVIPLYGKLADRLGVRPLLLASTALFALGSLACAAAASMPALVAARALQGLGGGGLLTLTMLATAALYPPADRGQRMGMLGAAYGLSTLVGPLGGALLLQGLSWHWAFLINVPGALYALAVLARAELGGAQARRAPFDAAGAALLAAGLVTLLLAVRGEHGAGPLLPAAMLPAGLSPGWLAAAAAVGLFAAFWHVERRAADPILPLGLFTRRPFAVVAVLSTLSGVMLFAVVVFVPLLLQQGLGLTPVRSALATLPLMLGITVGGQWCGRALRGGAAPRRLAGAAAVGLKLGLGGLAAVLHWLPAHADAATPWAVALALLPAGLGLGLLFPLISVMSQRSAPPEQIGVATAVPVMLRSLGGALGVAALGESLHGHMAAAALAGLHSQHEVMLAMADGTARIAAWAAMGAIATYAVSRGLTTTVPPLPQAAPPKHPA